MGGEARTGQVAVIFVSARNGRDDTGYAQAAAAMERAARARPGFRGIVSARAADGIGITVSYWANEAAAQDWRDDPAHAAVRERGRAEWYDGYDVVVADVTRDYAWRR